MKQAKVFRTNYAAIYLVSFLMAAFLGFLTQRDSCANADYARYMGPDTCPVAKK